MLRRFRFSLRWLLVGFTVLSVGFYFLFVRPTVIANRFVAVMGRGDYRNLDAIGVHPWFERFSGKPNHVEAQLQPREWADVWHFRRRIVVTATHILTGSDMGFSARFNVTVTPITVRAVEH